MRPETYTNQARKIPATPTATEMTESTSSEGPDTASLVRPTTTLENFGRRPVVAERPRNPAVAAPNASTTRAVRMRGGGSWGWPAYRGSPKNVRNVPRLSYNAVRTAPNSAAYHRPVRPAWLAAATTWSLAKNPESGGSPAMASHPTIQVAAVTGIALRRQPIFVL